ncbi:MAG: hypothetical protein Q8J97_05560 [Flavobacteriaceae bacterium]|nr:hypothetical protein [Flavobacteriaceae bacterium]
MSLQKLGYDGLKSYAGVMVASNLKVADRLNFGNSLVGTSATNGVLYASISDVINYFSGQRSKIVSGDIMGIVDDALFFGALSGGARITGADAQAFQIINQASPFNRETNLQLLETAILTGGRFLGDYIETTPQAPDALKRLRRPTRLLSR